MEFCNVEISINRKVNDPAIFYFEPYVVTSPDVFTRSAWSPALYHDNYRAEKNFKLAYVGALDFDHGMTLSDAIRRFKPFWHLIGTTRNHRRWKEGKRPCDRFRVIFKFERPIDDLAIYRHNMSFITWRNSADPACKDGARFFFPCREIVSINFTGKLAPVRPLPPIMKNNDEILIRQRAKYEWYRQNSRFPKWIKEIIQCGAPAGERNVTAFKMGIYLGKMGFAEAQIYELLAPTFIKEDFNAKELKRAIKQGYQRK